MNTNKYFGDRAFYKKVLAISVPIMAQSGITNLVSMLDNVMIGSLGTEAMSGVSIVNQLLFVFFMVIFGAGAAVGIFTSQYHGESNSDGVRYTFRIKVYVNLFVTILTVLILILSGTSVISLFLHADGEGTDLAKTLSFGLDYLRIMLVGLIPYALSQVYSSTLRECGEVRLPMYAGIVAILFNCSLNFVLIFGLLGFPALGVEGAAIATVISRFAELSVLMIAVHRNAEKYPFIKGVYLSAAVPTRLIKNVLLRGSPLLFNELIWSLAMTVKNQCLSTAGLDAVAALNIQTTVFNVLNIAYTALGNSVAIIIGNMLGAGKTEEAVNENRRLLVFSALAGAAMGVVQIALAPFFPLLYNTTPEIRSEATFMLIISGVFMAANSLAVSTYYTLRSGGLTFLTMLFDCVYAWVVTVSIALFLAYAVKADIYIMFAAVTFAECAKCLLGLLLVKKVRWARKLT